MKSDFKRLYWRDLVRHFLPLLIIILLGFLGVRYLIQPGFFTTHDGSWMIIRLSAFHQSLREGHFPVRWTQRLNNNYGYPVLNFLYPLPFYLAEIPLLLGFGLVNSVKVVFILAFIGSGLTMYLWLKRRVALMPALIGSLLYLYTPYRFVDIYVRGSLGESLGFLLVPLVFWGIDLVKDRPSLRNSSLLALAFAGLILSHNVFALIFGALALVYLGYQFCRERNKQALIFGLLSLGWGVAISLFFWLPALYETRFTHFPQTVVANYQEHFPTLRQLLYPKWGYGHSVPGNEDQIAFQIGIANYLAILVAGFLMLVYKKKVVYFFIGAFLIGMFLMLPFSSSFWQASRILPIMQFPWRFLALTTFASSAAIAFALKRQKQSFLVGALILGIAFYYNRHYLQGDRLEFFPDGYYATNESTTTVSNEYMPRWVKEPPLDRADQAVEVVEGEGELGIDYAMTGKIFWGIDTAGSVKVRVNALYYPGWTYYLDDLEIKPEIDKGGRPVIDLPPGEHWGKAVLKETPLRAVANLISLAALILAVAAFFKVGAGLLALILVGLVSFAIVFPLFRYGWISMHDDTQVARVYEMAQALRQGQFPVRWLGDLGYGFGYPLFNYYGPLPYYLGALFVLGGFNALTATKLMIFGAMLVAGAGVFYLLKSRFGVEEALLGAVLFLLLPFRAVELYVRGAISELWGMAFLPWVLVGIDRVVRGNERKGPLLIFSLAGLILSHNLTALMGLLLIVPYGLISLLSVGDRQAASKRLVIGALLALGLSAFYWLPALVERKEINVQRLIVGGGGDYSKHFVFINQLWDSPWGFGGSTEGQPDGMSFKLGKLHLLLALASVGLGVFIREREKKIFVGFFLITGLVAAFMTMSSSVPLWRMFTPVLGFFQYPWRFLVLVSLAVSILGGLLPAGLKKLPLIGEQRLSFLATIGLAGLVVGINLKYFQPQRHIFTTSAELTSPMALRWQASSRSDEFLPSEFEIPKNTQEAAFDLLEADRELKTEVVEQRFHRVKLKVEAEKNNQLFFNIGRFPGWQVFLDGGQAELINDPSGHLCLGLVVPQGEHWIEARLTNTTPRTLGNLVSLISLLALLIFRSRPVPVTRMGISSQD